MSADPTPPPSATAKRRQPRLLYQRSKPLFWTKRWCVPHDDGLLAQEEDHLVEIRMDGTVRHHWSLSGYPCSGSGWIAATHGENNRGILLEESPDGTVLEQPIPQAIYCHVDGNVLLIGRYDYDSSAAVTHGAIEQYVLPGVTLTDTLVAYGNETVPLFAAKDGDELVWFGTFESVHGIWSTVRGRTKRIATHPSQGAYCCEFALGGDAILAANQDCLLRIDRRSGTAIDLFRGWSAPVSYSVRSPLIIGQRVFFSYVDRILSVDVNGGTAREELKTHSVVDRFTRGADGQMLWCEEDGVYGILE